jgi:hypothetical protein
MIAASCCGIIGSTTNFHSLTMSTILIFNSGEPSSWQLEIGFLEAMRASVEKPFSFL